MIWKFVPRPKLPIKSYPRCLVFVSTLAAVAFAALPAVAQSGCYHSPEAPTDVLLLVGSAGMFYGSNAVYRLLRKRKS